MFKQIEEKGHALFLYVLNLGAYRRQYITSPISLTVEAVKYEVDEVNEWTLLSLANSRLYDPCDHWLALCCSSYIFERSTDLSAKKVDE